MTRLQHAPFIMMLLAGGGGFPAGAGGLDIMLYFYSLGNIERQVHSCAIAAGQLAGPNARQETAVTSILNEPL